MNNIDSFDSNRRLHAICHVWKRFEWERSGDSICTKCSRETYILLLYGKILWIHSLFFLNTTVEMCSCVITQWVLYTNRPDSIGLLYTFEWNCIASTHSYLHRNIYIFIFYLVNGWFWKALVCYSKFINSRNNLSCMSCEIQIINYRNVRSLWAHLKKFFILTLFTNKVIILWKISNETIYA